MLIFICENLVIAIYQKIVYYILRYIRWGLRGNPVRGGSADNQYFGEGVKAWLQNIGFFHIRFLTILFRSELYVICIAR
jgi:hypothetical protein